jgi:hypothetical protein
VIADGIVREGRVAARSRSATAMLHDLHRSVTRDGQRFGVLWLIGDVDFEAVDREKVGDITLFGEPLTGSRITERRLRPLLRREGLPPIRFHDLRHTAATLMLTAGVNPKVVSEMLGHTSVAITLDRYSHVMPTMHAEAVRRLDGVLSGRLRVQMRVRRIPRTRKGPDSRSESGLDGEIGTAYRIPGETSHASQARSAGASKRRMRHMRQDR